MISNRAKTFGRQIYLGKISEIALTFHDILEIALVLIKIFTK